MDADKYRQRIAETVQCVLKERGSFTARTDENRGKALILIEEPLENPDNLQPVLEQFSGLNLSLLVLSGDCPDGLSAKTWHTVTPSAVDPCVGEWVKAYEAVILFQPTLKSISRIAHILLDGLPAEIVYAALASMIKVYVTPLSENGHFGKYGAPIRSEAEKMFEKLKNFGIEELPAAKANERPGPAKGTRVILTLEEVREAVKGRSELAVEKETRFTPMAADYIREKKVKVKLL